MKKQDLEYTLWSNVVKKNENLILQDPFEGIEEYVDEHNLQKELWCAGADHESGFGMIISKIRPKIIVEVGSYLGYSGCTMAKLAKQYVGNDVSVVCVDPWLDVSNINDYNKRVQGQPSLHQRFLYNVKEAGHDDVIIPFQMPSMTAYKYFKKAGIQPDMVYIDGAHDYDDVYMDFTRWYDILKPGGVICGDDWAWEEVRAAVQVAVNELGITEITQNGIFWVVAK